MPMLTSAARDDAPGQDLRGRRWAWLAGTTTMPPDRIVSACVEKTVSGTVQSGNSTDDERGDARRRRTGLGRRLLHAGRCFEPRRLGLAARRTPSASRQGAVVARTTSTSW